MFFEECMKDGVVFLFEVGYFFFIFGICINGYSVFVFWVVGFLFIIMNYVYWYFLRFLVMYVNSKNIFYDNVFYNFEILEFKMYVKYFF